jgi:hypothetical protein
MADWTPSPLQSPQAQTQTWTLYTDGAWGHLGARASTVLISPLGLCSKYATKIKFKATNNISEYEGLILGLNKAKALGAKKNIGKNRFPGHGRTSKKGIHSTRARASQVSGNSKSPRAKVLRIYLKIHTKSRKLRSR